MDLPIFAPCAILFFIFLPRLAYKAACFPFFAVQTPKGLYCHICHLCGKALIR